ncbi:hypothetical protein BpHYR1_029192 [Brachionus plicatilis]|uniref:RNA-directed DNA polymerase from mobile element jockey-like n=1 Tax=Brachionus plicatilis TaxID=10195 RepID=A0A3M7RDG2_BRAPC|nr:hypothetical protein BpHYR1_029192 [Brachionus plicatilis]
MEYASPITILNVNNISRLHGIQYKALQIIHKEKFKCSNTYLHDLSGIESVNDRFLNLSKRYIEKNILSQNPLMLDLIENQIHTIGNIEFKLNNIQLKLSYFFGNTHSRDIMGGIWVRHYWCGFSQIKNAIEIFEHKIILIKKLFFLLNGRDATLKYDLTNV